MRKDSQVRKVYGWESKWYHWNTQMMRLKDAREWVRWACKQYGVKPPIVRAVHKKAPTSFYYPEEHSINLKAKHTNMAVALHEAAHAIQDAYYDWDKIEDHGPEFAGIYIRLLAGSTAYPESAIIASAEAAGIQWNRRLTPRYLKARKRKARKKRA